MREFEKRMTLLFVLLTLITLLSGCIGSENTENASMGDNGSGDENKVEKTILNIAKAGEVNRTENSGNTTTKALETLLQDLKSPEKETRLDAVEALGERAEPEALEALIQALDDEDESVRLSATHILGKMGSNASEALIQTIDDEVDDPQKDINEYAVFALIETGDERTAETLNRVFEREREEAEKAFESEEDKDENEKSEAFVQAVKAVEKGQRAEIANGVKEKIFGTSVEDGEMEIDALAKALNSEEQSAESYAQIALPEGEEMTLEALTEAMRSGKGHIRVSAVMALGELKEENAIEPLIQVLAADKVQVRNSAALALGNIGDKRAVDPLINELKHNREETVRVSSALALGKIGEERAVSYLVQSLGEGNFRVKESVALALGNIGNTGNEEAVEALIKVLEGEDDGVIASTSSEDDEELVKNTILALGEIKDERAVTPLIEILKDETERKEVRKATLSALGSIGTPEAVEALVEVLNNKNMVLSYRKEAVKALARTEDQKAAEALIQKLNDKELGVPAEDALTGMGETAVEPLIETLESGDKELKMDVALLLIKSGDTRALEPLIQAFN